MFRRIKSSRYNWIVYPMVYSVLAMLIYIFAGALLVDRISKMTIQIISLGQGLYDTYGFTLTGLYAYIFWLTFSMGIFVIFRFAVDWSIWRITSLSVLISLIVTLSSDGIVLLFAGISESIFYAGFPLAFSRTEVILLPFRTTITRTFNGIFMALDFLIWFVLLMVFWFLARHLRSRVQPTIQLPHS